MKLIETALFHHMDEPELSKTLALLNAAKRAFKKNEFIFTAGLCAPILSVVLSGSVSIITEDYWGSRSIIGMAHEGDIF